ncbi:MAG: helix-turn-helix domain-containing protein [Candidatus Methanofishera endochildressiae]|uniref:Helix-turn-helix domain-containing protein n=1 Tax=Candidatus Methanofishera endochildressiae TaxID=2738884 RepID=A0A7Z0MNV3_9GAMM|nr:helix-turn-helix domain-containing protein [Candidatus Methanofishera endochildressiae]
MRCCKNEVRDVINGDRRLTVREVADKCGISKTTAHQILANDLNMNRVATGAPIHTNF